MFGYRRLHRVSVSWPGNCDDTTRPATEPRLKEATRISARARRGRPGFELLRRQGKLRPLKRREPCAKARIHSGEESVRRARRQNSRNPGQTAAKVASKSKITLLPIFFRISGRQKIRRDQLFCRPDIRKNIGSSVIF